MGSNPGRSTEKVVSGGWFTSESFICGVAFYDLFVHSTVYCTGLDCTGLDWTGLDSPPTQPLHLASLSSKVRRVFVSSFAPCLLPALPRLVTLTPFWLRGGFFSSKEALLLLLALQLGE